MNAQAVNEMYWGLAILIIGLLALIAGLGAATLWMRSRRFKDLARTRDLRRVLILGGRDARAETDLYELWDRHREAEFETAIGLFIGRHMARMLTLFADARGESPPLRLLETVGETAPIRVVTV